MLPYSTDCLKRNSKMKNKEQHTFPFIERLLDGVEVEWKPLGEVAEIGTGSSNRKDEDENGAYPFYVRSKNILRSSTYQFNETAIIIPGEGGIGDIYHFVKGKYALHQRAYRVHLHTNELLDKFVYHFMRANFKAYIVSKSVGATATSIRKPMLENFFIPIPPIAVQEEIVDILDKFTELEAELEAELEGRKRQYEYYRNHLLSFELSNEGDEKSDSLRWLTIGEISKNISSGGTPRSSVASYYGGNIPWLRTQEVNFSEIWDTEIKITEEGLESSSAKYIPANCIIVAMYGATVGRVGINKIPLTTNQACANIEVNEEIALYRYVFHCLSDLYQYIKSLGKGSQTNINVKVVRNIQIPIPPLSEQQRIVSILDKFDTLTTSISEGLPKEIELRRKQYEFYRDKLLSFAQH